MKTYRFNPPTGLLPCTRCKLLRPLSAFHERAKTGGYSSWCKDCKREYDRAKRAQENAAIKAFLEATK